MRVYLILSSMQCFLWFFLNCSFLDLGVTLVLLLSVAPSASGFWNPLLPAIGPLALQGAPPRQSPFNMASSWPSLLPGPHLASTDYGVADHFNAVASDFSRRGPNTIFYAYISFSRQSPSYSSFLSGFMNCECLRFVFQICEK